MELDFYINKLNLQPTKTTKIDDAESISSTVYKITLKDNKKLILKISYSKQRYNRETYFLNKLKNLIPVPKIINSIEPTEEKNGAILMEFLNGHILPPQNLSDKQSFEMGKLLAQIHNHRGQHYGDIANNKIYKDPLKELFDNFDESLTECKDVINPLLLKKSEEYFKSKMLKIKIFDGPCIIHRDFKPGNIIFDKDNEILGLIDWENSKYGFASEDFIRMDQLIWQNKPKTKKYFLDGYSKIRKLPSLKELLPLLRVCGAFGAIGFTVARNKWETEYKYIFDANLNFIINFFEWNKNEIYK